MRLFYSRDHSHINPFFRKIHLHDLDLLVEKHKWTFTESLEDADIVPCSFYNFQYGLDDSLLQQLKPNQTLLIWYVETPGDHLTPEYLRKVIQSSALYGKHPRTIFAHTNLIDADDPLMIPINVMFNRQKANMTDYDEEVCRFKTWTWDVPSYTYSLGPIEKKYSPENKSFLCPNRVPLEDADPLSFAGRKISLHQHIRNLNVGVYLSDPRNGYYLLPNNWENNPEIAHINTSDGGSWYPIGDKYYNTSYISVCIESLIRDPNMFYPSEKYFDPLIKGNFPLIYSGPYVIQRLQEIYGFKFPDWIDYSYDFIEKESLRFPAFLDSVTKASAIPLTELHRLYEKDKHILEHNRNVFYNRPYDSLFDKLKESIQKLNWNL